MAYKRQTEPLLGGTEVEVVLAAAVSSEKHSKTEHWLQCKHLGVTDSGLPRKWPQSLLEGVTLFGLHIGFKSSGSSAFYLYCDHS